MYKLIEIKEYCMTRDLIFENEKTKKIEMCFDDSDLIYRKVKLHINELYDCKIKLLGDVTEDLESRYGKVIELEKETVCIIGNRKFFLVHDCFGNLYYINYDEVKLCPQKFLYNFTRCDLLQLNNVVHERCIE